MKTQKDFFCSCLLAVMLIFVSCKKESNTTSDLPATTSVNLISRIVSIDSNDVASNKDSVQAVFKYDNQNRLISITENDLTAPSDPAYFYYYTYIGSDSMPSQYAEGPSGKTYFKNFYTYKNGMLLKDSAVGYGVSGASLGVAYDLKTSIYLDTLGSLVAFTKEVQPQYPITTMDTLELTSIVTDSKSNIINWAEFTDFGNTYKIMECAYSNFENPFFAYGRKNITLYNNYLFVDSYAGDLINTLHRDTKYLPTNLKIYKVAAPVNTVETESKFQYSFDNTGRVNYIVKRYTTTGSTEAIKYKIYYN